MWSDFLRILMQKCNSRVDKETSKRQSEDDDDSDQRCCDHHKDDFMILESFIVADIADDGRV